MTEKHRVKKTEIAIILEIAIVQRAAVSYIHLSLHSEILSSLWPNVEGRVFSFLVAPKRSGWTAN